MQISSSNRALNNAGLGSPQALCPILRVQRSRLCEQNDEYVFCDCLQQEERAPDKLRWAALLHVSHVQPGPLVLSRMPLSTRVEASTSTNAVLEALRLVALCASVKNRFSCLATTQWSFAKGRPLDWTMTEDANFSIKQSPGWGRGLPGGPACS